jgi:hypothetical protein
MNVVREIDVNSKCLTVDANIQYPRLATPNSNHDEQAKDILQVDERPRTTFILYQIFVTVGEEVSASVRAEGLKTVILSV